MGTHARYGAEVLSSNGSRYATKAASRAAILEVEHPRFSAGTSF
ncbi:hypothetical protein [Lactococcus protaetiae]|nr:hypothetical protein [Lactococcus protaetiae]